MEVSVTDTQPDIQHMLTSRIERAEYSRGSRRGTYGQHDASSSLDHLSLSRW